MSVLRVVAVECAVVDTLVGLSQGRMVVFVVKVGEICCTDLDDFLVRRPMSFGSHVAPVPAYILPSQTRTFLVCSSSLLKRGVHVLSQGTLLYTQQVADWCHERELPSEGRANQDQHSTIRYVFADAS